MYNPAHFQEARPEILAAAIAEHPLAALVTSGAGGLHASHIPLLYLPAEGVLRGHMARANSHWRDGVPPCEALAIFTGPQQYISPNRYPSKHDDGKVVPTWNYVVVHAHGTLAIKDDPQWLLANVTALTDQQEAASPTPWRVYIQNLLKAIVGVELIITRLDGKWKLSQNRSQADRNAVAGNFANFVK